MSLHRSQLGSGEQAPLVGGGTEQNKEDLGETLSGFKALKSQKPGFKS